MDPYPYLANWGMSREQFKHDIENDLTIETGWQKNDTGYWYVHSDGSYPKDKYEKITAHSMEQLKVKFGSDFERQRILLILILTLSIQAKSRFRLLI